MSNSYLGGYELIRRIGSGGMAEVFEAKRVGFGGFQQRVALKCIRSELAADDRFVQQFINEARLGSQLQHPNIVAVQDFNLVDGVLYLAMEYVDGSDLQSLINYYQASNLKCAPSLAAHILIHALAGLGHAHDARDSEGEHLQVIHRDIKPPNIMLTRQGLVKIADFGIAKATSSLYQTQTGGTVKGSLAYMSPEQLMARPLTPQSDLFSMGVVLYEMLMLKRLFAGEPITDVIYKITTMDIKAELGEFSEQFPEFYPILKKALAQQADDRFTTAESFALALRPLASDHEARSQLTSEVATVLKQQVNRKGVITDQAAWATGARPAVTTGGTRASLQSVSGNTPQNLVAEATRIQTSPPAEARALTDGTSNNAPAAGPVLPTTTPSKLPQKILAAVGGVVALAFVLLVLLLRGKDEPAAPIRDETAAEKAARASLPASVKPGKVLWVRGSEMVEIASGPFLMGEKGKFQSVPGFFIDRYEVTNSQYLDFLNACPAGSACGPTEMPAYLKLASPQELQIIASLPVVSVNWNDASAYAKWAGKSLPQSIQWEKAARGVDARRYPWGEDFGAGGFRAWLNAPAGAERDRPLSLLAESVYSKKWSGDVSPYGVYGMAGNVAEWADDADPSFPGSRVVAGGSFSPGSPDMARTTARQALGGNDRSSSVGFRCVIDSNQANEIGVPLTLDQIATSKKLRIGAEPSSDAMFSKKPDGTYQGLEYELGTMLAKELSVEPEVVEAKYSMLAGMIVSNKFDVLINGYVPDTQVQGVAWSKSYLEFGLCLISRKKQPVTDISRLSGKKVAVYKDPSAERTAKAILPKDCEVIPFEEGYFSALEQGRVDAVLYDAPYAREEVAEYANLTITAYNLNRSSYHIGVRMGEWSLVAKLDEAIDKVRSNETFPQLVTRHMGGALAFGILGLHPGKMARLEAGEKLQTLVQRELGSSARYREVVELNRYWLPDAKQLQTGMMIQLPAN